MATADSVKEKLQNLIYQSNATTGNTDTDLTAAIAALIAGFGQGGGATDVTDSIVSVAFSSTNAYMAQTGFEGIAPEDAKIAIFILQGDQSNAVNNKCLLAFFNRLYNLSPTSGRLLYFRLKNGSYDFQFGSSVAYDLIVNAGDTFRMVVVK